LLKPHGYATGQFGKNHFGDLNKYLPTVHGFDEFFGNLYHLNAEEEPELPDYPKEADFPRLYQLQLPRGVIRSWASDTDDPTEERPGTSQPVSPSTTPSPNSSSSSRRTDRSGRCFRLTRILARTWR
jgi:arylsulfatase A-like enzyme